MEDINLKELYDYYISKILIAVFVLLGVILLGAIYSLFFQDALYKSNTTLVLAGTAVGSGANIDTSAGITQNDINLNSKLVATYREVIKSKTVLKEVIDTLGLPYTTDALQKMITVSIVTDTEMISISVEGKNAIEVSKIANELSRVFSLKIVDIYNIDNISIIDRAEVASVPSNINIIKQLAIYILVGLILGFSTIFVIYYFDTTLKDQDQIEKMGLVVLCAIPQNQKEKREK